MQFQEILKPNYNSVDFAEVELTYNPKHDEPRYNDSTLYMVSRWRWSMMCIGYYFVVADEEGHGGPEGGHGKHEGEGPHGRHEARDGEGAGLLLLQHLQHSLYPRHRPPQQVRQIQSQGWHGGQPAEDRW